MEKIWNGLVSDDPKLAETIRNFDYEKYKKDIEKLNELTSDILKNNPSCVKGYKSNSFDDSILEVNYDETFNKRKELIDKLSGLHNINENDIPKENKSGNLTSNFKRTNIADQEQMKKNRNPFFDDNGNPVVMDREFHDKMHKIKVEEKKKDPKFQKEIDRDMGPKMGDGFFSDAFTHDFVGLEITEMIKQNKKTINNTLPGILKNLDDLNMYGVYAISDNKFNCAYIDFVIEETEKPEIKNAELDPFGEEDWGPSLNSEKSEEIKMKTISFQPFSSNGRLKSHYIDIENKDINTAIEDFINEKFIERVKLLSDINKNSVPTGLNNDLDIRKLSSLETRSKIVGKINSISNYIQMKNMKRPANFIIGSKKNIDLIVKILNGSNHKIGKTYKYVKNIETIRQELIINENLGDMIIIGMKPKDEEVGIKLVLNEKTMANYTFSDDDIIGVNLEFDFFNFGSHPEYNYFNFNLIS